METENKPKRDLSDGLIGAHVKRAREAKGMSQNDLSEALSIRGLALPPQTIYKIEQGTRRILASELTIFANALSTSPLSLLGLGTNRSTIVSAGSRLEESMRNLESAAVACARAILSYAQAADRAGDLHENDRMYADESLPRQTPAWIASAAIESLDATLRLNKVTVEDGFAKKALDAMHADYEHFHRQHNG